MLAAREGLYGHHSLALRELSHAARRAGNPALLGDLPDLDVSARGRRSPTSRLGARLGDRFRRVGRRPRALQRRGRPAERLPAESVAIPHLADTEVVHAVRGRLLRGDVGAGPSPAMPLTAGHSSGCAGFPPLASCPGSGSSATTSARTTRRTSLWPKRWDASWSPQTPGWLELRDRRARSRSCGAESGWFCLRSAGSGGRRMARAFGARRAGRQSTRTLLSRLTHSGSAWSKNSVGCRGPWEGTPQTLRRRDARAPPRRRRGRAPSRRRRRAPRRPAPAAARSRPSSGRS